MFVHVSIVLVIADAVNKIKQGDELGNQSDRCNGDDELVHCLTRVEPLGA